MSGNRSSIVENLLANFASKSFLLISSILSWHVSWELREKQKFCKKSKNQVSLPIWLLLLLLMPVLNFEFWKNVKLNFRVCLFFYIWHFLNFFFYFSDNLGILVFFWLFGKESVHKLREILYFRWIIFFLFRSGLFDWSKFPCLD